MTSQDFDMTDTRVVLIDADPATVMGAVERLGLTGPVLEAVESLGVGDRMALAPTRIDPDGSCQYRYGIAWRVDGLPAEQITPDELSDLDEPGYVKVTWDVRVEAGGDTGTILSTTTRFAPTDDASGERLASAWTIVGPMSAALSKRALAAVTLIAEEELGRSRSSGTIGVPAALLRGSRLALAA